MESAIDDAATLMSNQLERISENAASVQSRVASYNCGKAIDGMSILDAKTAILLRYNAALCRYAAARLRRADDEQVQAHTNELVKHWVALERVRPLEKKLRPHIAALLERAARPRTGAARAPKPRPDPSNLALDDDDDDDEGEDAEEDDYAGRAEEDEQDGEERERKTNNRGVRARDRAQGGEGTQGGSTKRGDAAVYRPPRIAEVLYDGDREAIEARERRAREKMATRAARSRAVREMLGEVSGRPDVVRDDGNDDEGVDGDVTGGARGGGNSGGSGGGGGGGSRGAREIARLRREEEERTRYEEENFVRLNVTRQDKKRRNTLERAAERSGGGVGDVTGDAFADLMGVAERVIGKSGAGSAASRAANDRVDALDALDRGDVVRRPARKSSNRKHGGRRRS